MPNGSHDCRAWGRTIDTQYVNTTTRHIRKVAPARAVASSLLSVARKAPVAMVARHRAKNCHKIMDTPRETQGVQYGSLVTSFVTAKDQWYVCMPSQCSRLDCRQPGLVALQVLSILQLRAQGLVAGPVMHSGAVCKVAHSQRQPWRRCRWMLGRCVQRPAMVAAHVACLHGSCTMKRLVPGT